MSPIETLNSYNQVPRKTISWRAILAGTITVLSVLLVLNLIGLGIGAGTIDPTEEADPLSGIGTGSIIWWVLSNLIALFAGGFVAARTGASFTNTSGVMQGLMTWALYTIISVWLLTTVVGGIISGVGNVLGGVFTTAGQITEDTLGPVIEDQIEELDLSLEQAQEEFQALIEEADNPEALQAEIREIFSNAVNIFEGSFEEVDRQALVDALVEYTDMSEGEAEQTVDSNLQRYEQLRTEAEEFITQARETANEQADIVAGAVSRASIYLAIALILGIIVSAIGGFVGVKNLREDYERNYTFPETERINY